MDYLHPSRTALTALWTTFSLTVSAACLFVSLSGCGISVFTATCFAFLAACKWFPQLSYLLIFLLTVCLFSPLRQYVQWHKQSLKVWDDALIYLNTPLTLLTQTDSEHHHQFQKAQQDIRDFDTTETAPVIDQVSIVSSTESKSTPMAVSPLPIVHRPTLIPPKPPEQPSYSRFDLVKLLPQADLTWSKSSTYFNNDVVLPAKPAEIPSPLWDRVADDEGATGVFRYISIATEGSPDIKQIAKSLHPVHDLMVLVDNLPDQQRRHRIVEVVRLLHTSPLVTSANANPRGTGQLKDEWGSSLLLGALMGVSQDEYAKLTQMINRSKLIEQLDSQEYTMLFNLAERIAELAVRHPVQRNTTYDFIVSGRPLEQAPQTLMNMLDMFKMTTGVNGSRFLVPDLEVSPLTIDVFSEYADVYSTVSHHISPSAQQYSKLLRTRRNVVILCLVCHTGWFIISVLNIALLIYTMK